MIFLKRLTVFIILFNSFSFTSLGIISFPDHLENELKQATSDTARVMVYNHFTKNLLNMFHPDNHQILQYAQEGLALAEQIQFDKGSAELYRTMGRAYFNLHDFENAIEYYEKSLNICEKIQDLNDMAQNYYDIGLIYREQSKIHHSLEMMYQALSLWKQLENTNHKLIAYQRIINLYMDVSEFRLADSYAKEALKLAIETGNRHQEASLYDQLAHINYSTGNMQAVEEYYQKSLPIFEELGDQLSIARITYNIAESLHSDDTEKAVVLFQKSAALYEKNAPDHYELFEVYNSIANIFQTVNNIDSAKHYKELALKKAILSGNRQTISNAHYAIGLFYNKIGEANRAEKEFNQANKIASKSGLYELLSKTFLELSLLKFQKGDSKVAFEYLQKYHVVNDSLNREDNKRNVQQLTQQYEFEKDMIEKNEIIRAQLESQEHAMKYQKTIVIIISIGLFFSAILLIFILRSNLYNRKANIKLEAQHREILCINDQLKESHQQLFKYKDNLEEMVKEQTAKLQQSEMQLRTLSDNLPGGCIYRKHVFRDGIEIISYISSTAEEWLGMSAKTVMEDIMHFYQRIVPEDFEKKRQLEQESIRSTSPYSCEYRLMKGDREVWLLENAMPYEDTNHYIVWDAIVVDITDRKKFEKELIQAKELAEESDRLKSSFLANMSHEIRTPMNGIVGFLGFIEREDLPIEKRHAYTGIIRSNVQQLLQLIGDIVDLSKIDSQQLVLHYVTFDLNNMLDELETFFHDSILKDNKHLELILDRSQFIFPCIIKFDTVRVQQILKNLVGNAIKFTKKGYVRFGYQITEDGNHLYFFVEDTGIGIPASQQGFIFDRFWKASDEAEHIMYGGTGLGLPISKNLVEMMDGQIGLISDEGVGSTFNFTLPFIPEKG